jgi:hypothetical protein
MPKKQDDNPLQRLIKDLWNFPDLHQRWENEGTNSIFEEYQLSEEQRDAFDKIDWKTYRRLKVHPFVGVIRWAMTEEGRQVYTMNKFLPMWEKEIKNTTDY